MADPVRILIVEDVEDDALLLERELARQGITALEPVRVDSAETVRQALATRKFDIVLCDYMVPGLTVETSLDIRRDLDLDVPLIVISGIVRMADVVDVLRSGADDFVEKDDLLRLGPAIERALRGVRERRERRLTEEKLRQSQKLETIGQLTGGLAHDLNNNLTIIRGNLGFVRDAVGDLAELRTIENATTRSAHLVQRLLAFARKQHLEPNAVDVGELVTGLQPLLISSLGKSIDLRLSTSGTECRAFVDRNLLENALLNLAINARDAMPDGGSFAIDLADVQIGEDEHPDNADIPAGAYLRISVKDTGVGMPPAILEHALEPFFTTKDVGEGSGLGLPMVYGFVRQSGGDLHIESEIGKGTELRLYLPVPSAGAALAAVD